MKRKNQCANATCSCATADGQLYCSKYCQQAVEQAVERYYCQCDHACDRATLTRTFVLSGSGIPSALEPELQPL